MATKQRMRPRILDIFAILVALVALAAVAAVTVASVGLPGCESCHLKDAGFSEATRATSHAKADTTCIDCHVLKSNIIERTRFGVYEAFGMWVPLLDPTSTDATMPQDSRCLRCHADVMDKVVKTRGLAVVHAACSVGKRCTDCHSEVGHGDATPWPRGLSMNDCASCHKTKSAPLACDSCHLGKVERTAAADPEFAFTHGATWQQTHGMGQMSSCSLCHKSDACARCHGPGVPHGSDFMKEHSAASLQEGATCLACHQQTFCFSCHLIDMPHTKEFISGHSDIVKKDGEGGCMRCHTVVDCDTCHITHVHPGGAVGKIPSPGRGGK